jgi:hypothetical protein
MDTKLGIALIASALVALSMPARTSAEAGDPTPIDFVNIGDPTSEAGHNQARNTCCSATSMDMPRIASTSTWTPGGL